MQDRLLEGAKGCAKGRRNLGTEREQVAAGPGTEVKGQSELFFLPGGKRRAKPLQYGLARANMVL